MIFLTLKAVDADMILIDSCDFDVNAVQVVTGLLACELTLSVNQSGKSVCTLISRINTHYDHSIGQIVFQLNSS